MSGTILQQFKWYFLSGVFVFVLTHTLHLLTCKYMCVILPYTNTCNVTQNWTGYENCLLKHCRMVPDMIKLLCSFSANVLEHLYFQCFCLFPQLAYIEGNKLIELANETFGFNGWSHSVTQQSIGKYQA